MSGDIREYLTERFRSDAATLRERVVALTGSRKPVIGPDANISALMANACDEVAALVQLLPVNASLPDMLIALNGLLPQLAARANEPSVATVPALRAVYAGAGTRVQEVIAAETRAATPMGALQVVDDAYEAGEDDAPDAEQYGDRDDDDEDDDDDDDYEPKELNH